MIAGGLKPNVLLQVCLITYEDRGANGFARARSVLNADPLRADFGGLDLRDLARRSASGPTRQDALSA